MPRLASDEVLPNPYRIIWDFMRTVDASEAIVTHDLGWSTGPTDAVLPGHRPRSYIGWGKSHALGTVWADHRGAGGGAEKFCVNFMGDAALG